MTRQPDAPRHVVTSAGDAETVLRRLARDGWDIQEGFALPLQGWDAPPRLVLHGRIGDEDTLQLAVLAAARGAGIVAVCDTESP
ncbi:LuxR family transcriptional regulator, partial [Actinoplanes sp. NPDC051633]